MSPSSDDSAAGHESLQGVVERLTFHSEESGYTVARFKAHRASELVTVVGAFANIQAGQTLHLEGVWKEHPRFGPQFQVLRYRELKPATITAIEKYLGSGLIKGVGPVTARRIVAHFGRETLEIIENAPERLAEVPGIARKRVALIRDAWQTQKAIKEVMLFLQGHGVSTTYAVKIYKQYGAESIATVSENPYRLAADVYGIGFVTADTIARNLGIAPDSEFRHKSGLLHILNKAAEDGHCYLPRAQLVATAVERLALTDYRPEPAVFEGRIDAMLAVGELMSEPAAEPGATPCYHPVFHRTEERLAERVLYLARRPLSVDRARVRSWIDRFTAARGIQLSDEQRRAVEMAAEARVLVLTGGPGTGKTTTTRTIVALWKAMGKSIALASPTGRAAQRLSEVTGQEAKTIHRLLEFDPRTFAFKRDEENPIPVAAVAVDEASMLDLFLANSLFKAVAPDAQVLLIGDIDQLPSVGAGNVLRDLIASEQVTVARLTQVFRQAATSRIVQNAHRINRGEFPELEKVSSRPSGDCLWLEAPEPTDGVAAIRDLLTHLTPRLGFDPQRDVQVLCPMTRGEVGTRNLNAELQALLNPPATERAQVSRGGLVLRVGDRVIQKVNNYDREVFNGDMGTVAAVDLEEQEVLVTIGDREVAYDFADLDELGLAFAISIHKSQGSEYPAVLIPLYMQNYLMLNRNLLYTALTRAKKLAVLVGPRRAIGFAVRQAQVAQRHTLLAERLRRLLP